MTLRSALFALLAASVVATPVFAQAPAQSLRDKCGEDIKKFCADVKPGGGGILQCLRAHEDKLSQACKDARNAMRRQIERPNAPPAN